MLPVFVLSVYKKRIIEQVTMLCNIIPVIMKLRIVIEDLKAYIIHFFIDRFIDAH